MNDENAQPLDHEVREQLRVMLESGIFIRKPRLASLLAFLTESALNKTTLTESMIAMDCLDGGARIVRADGNIRVNVFHLRNVLAEYYASTNDPVLIEVPNTGRGYGAEFSYNPAYPVEGIYRRALANFKRSFYGDDDVSKFYWDDLREGTKLDPSHARLRALRGLADILEMLFDGMPSHLECAVINSRAALDSNPDLWLPHTVLGAVHCCRYEWGAAEREFEASMRLDPYETLGSPLYLVFLAAIGKNEEAISLTASRVRMQPFDDTARIMHTLMLYTNYDSRAIDLLDPWSGDSPYRWRGDFWPWCLFVNAVYPCDRILNDVGEEQPVFVGNKFCEQRFKGFSILFKLWNELITADDIEIEYGKHYYYKTAGYGFEIGVDEGEAGGPHPWEATLCALGAKEYDYAISFLESAMESHNPFTVLLHRWPFLRKLWTHERFGELVKRMNLPTPVKAASNARGRYDPSSSGASG